MGRVYTPGIKPSIWGYRRRSVDNIYRQFAPVGGSPVWERGGIALTDPFSGAVHSINDGVWGVDEVGHDLTFDGGAGSSILTARLPDLTADFTFVFYGSCGSAAGFGDRLAGFGTDSAGWQLRFAGPWSFRDGATWQAIGGTSVDDDVVRMYVFVHSGTSLLLYTDGEFVASITVAALTSYTGARHIFASGTGGSNMPGTCRAWWYEARAYGSAEVASLQRDAFGLFRPARRRSYRGPVGPSLLHYRHRNDDGSESGATFKAAEDVDVTVSPGEEMRIRLLVSGLETGQYQLEAAEDGTEDWFPVPVEE